MTSTSHPWPIFSKRALLVLACLAAGCLYDDTDRRRTRDAGHEAVTCRSEGQRHQVGEIFSTLDGCSVCSCALDGEVRCVELACARADADVENPADAGGSETDAGTQQTDAEIDEMDADVQDASEDTDATLGASDASAIHGCLAAGRLYALNERYLAQDGCSVCTCYAPGLASCDGKWCRAELDAATPDAAAPAPDDAGGDGCVSEGKCVYNDTFLSWGETIDTGRECGFCECNSNHYLACYSQPCETVPDGGPGPGCWSGRQFYDVGDTFVLGDRCTRATCVGHDELQYTWKSCWLAGVFPDRGYERCDPGPTCVYGGKLFGAGSIIYPDACETCTCRPDGTFGCSSDACAQDAGLGG